MEADRERRTAQRKTPGPGRVAWARHPWRPSGGRTSALSLASATTAPASSRAAIEWLREHLEPMRMQDVLLIVSELVTNAVLHGPRSPWARIVVEVAVDAPGDVWLRVGDGGRGFDPAALSPPGPDSSSGHGLEMVAGLADAVGVEEGSLFRVWARLGRRGDRTS